MRRIVRTGFMGVAASVLLVGAAQAVPVNAIAISPSHFNLSLAWSAFGTATGSGVITGSLSTDLRATATNLSLIAGGANFDASSFDAPGLVFGPLAFENFHIDVTLPASASTKGVNPFHPDLAGSVISVDNGQVVQGGSATIFDFSKLPAVVTAPTGSLTTLDVGAGLWTVPFTTTSTLLRFGVPANFTFGTDLTLRIIPEPGTLVLLGAGLMGLAAVGVRRRHA